MNIIDEIYYETHEESLMEAYQDYLMENNLTENDVSFFEFRELI